MLVLPRQRRTGEADGNRTRNLANHTSDQRRHPLRGDHDRRSSDHRPRQRLPARFWKPSNRLWVEDNEQAVKHSGSSDQTIASNRGTGIRARNQVQEKITMPYWHRLPLRVTPTIKRFIVTAGAGLLLAIPTFATATAHASPIGECGSIVADGVSNITTRDVSCADARSFAQKISDLSRWRSGQITFPGWHSYSVQFHNQHSQVDVRATRINRVIHFQIGPYGVSDGGNGKCAGIPAGQPCY
jgi:hypothetical protein